MVAKRNPTGTAACGYAKPDCGTTENSEALGEVSIRARVGEIVYSGNGVATDIVEASARAWLEVINASIAKVGIKKEAIQAI